MILVLPFFLFSDVFAVDPANILPVDAETDGENGFTKLDGVRGVDTFTVDSSTYAIVTSFGDDGIQVIDISNPANILPVDAETDGENGFTELYYAYAVDTFTVDSSTYAIVTSFGADGIQMIQLSDASDYFPNDLFLEKQSFESGQKFSEGTHFADSQSFSDSMIFDKYQHFGDDTDFTDALQIFKEGTTFGDGTKFNSDGSQSIPKDSILSFGVMLEDFTCVTVDCMPDDSNKFLSPGELLPTGIDPAPSYSSISSNNNSFSVDGLGLVMTFENVIVDGTIKTDLYDPANIPSSTVSEEGIATISTNIGIVNTIGSVIDLSTETAEISGEITITLPYLESNIPAGITESDLVVLHYIDNVWVTESNCTVDSTNNSITCTVTNLSPFSVGSKSGSSGATSTGSSNAHCNSNGFSVDDSLRVYEINYDLCYDKKIQVLSQSTCGPVSYKIIIDDQIRMGELSIQQPRIRENILIHTLNITEIADSFRITLENEQNYFEKLFIPEKLHDTVTQCTGTIQIYSDSAFSSEQQNTVTTEFPQVPSWIKNNAGWWADGIIDDSSFVQGIQYLIKEDIITIPDLPKSINTGGTVPEWIKNNAGWWADDLLDDDTFVNGIKFLVEKGIIVIDVDVSGENVSGEEFTITPSNGSRRPGCDRIDEYGCYAPGVTTMSVGDTVIFSNTDNSPHTFTAGTPRIYDTPSILSEEFNSGMINPDSSYEWTPTNSGNVPYFCAVHPWMTGLIVIN